MKNRDPFDLLASFVAQGYQIVLVPNPGNHGDGLILAATIQRFESLRIPYYTLRETAGKDLKKVLYVYGGGGNLNSKYRDASNFIESIKDTGAPLVVLPHSVFGVSSLLPQYKGDIVIFARELQTAEYLESVNILTYLSDDMAIGLDVSDPRFMLPTYISSKVKSLSPSNSSSNSLPFFFALRSDQEASPCRFDGLNQMTVDLIMQNNIDASVYWDPKYLGTRGFQVDNIDCHKLFNSVSFFLSLLSVASDPIVTDRLHVAVAGCLLGKKVIAIDNSYGKVSSVYHYSLKHRPSFDISFCQSVAEVVG